MRALALLLLWILGSGCAGAENWPGCRRHPDNEDFQTGAQRKLAGGLAGCEKQRKRALKARRRGEPPPAALAALLDDEAALKVAHTTQAKRDLILRALGHPIKCVVAAVEGEEIRGDLVRDEEVEQLLRERDLLGQRVVR